jgi:NDP-sugar pyrophosphorylase family protein
VINLHHLPGSIKDVVAAGRPPGLQVAYSLEAEILGTAGGLKRAESHFRGGGTLTLINSDFVVDCDLGAAMQAHRRSGAVATMVLVPAQPGQSYGVVEIAEDGLIHRISGRPETRPGRECHGYTFTGIHLLEPEILDSIPPGIPCCINKDIYPSLLKAGSAIHGFVHHGQWLEFGTPGLFLEGSFALLRSMGGPPAVAPTLSAPPWVERPFLLGPDCTFGDGASCSAGLIAGARLKLGPGARLQRTIVHDDVEIGAAAELVDCIVDSGVVLPPGSRLQRAMVVPWSDDLSAALPLQRLGECGIVEF